MHMSLYRTYRPRSFADVIGQDAAVYVIQNAVRRNKVGHAYLFSGPRGSGKTSLARLLARAVNCPALSSEGEPCGECANCRAIGRGEHLDVIEIDGASNNGVDEVRELRAKVSLAPFSASRKVYIIDEVHMLSTAAFNALLKTIEEPPEHVLFILATTEPHKVPVTIRSRCQHIPFHRISVPHIRERLRRVCEMEEIDVSEDALWELSRQADGALRDALSLMEQAVTLSSGKLTLESIETMLGGGTRPEVERWLAMIRQDCHEAHSTLKSMIDSGVSPERLLDQIFLILRDIWVVRRWGEGALGGLDLSDQERDFLSRQAPFWSETDLSRVMDHCLRLFGRVRLGIRGDVFVGALMAGFLAETGIGEERSAPEKSMGRKNAEDLPEPHSEEAEREMSSGRRFVPLTKKQTAEALPVKERVSPEVEISGKDVEHGTDSNAAQFAEDPRSGWESLLEKLKGQDLALFVALIKCKVGLSEDGTLMIVFPEEEPFLADLISQERHAWRLATLCHSLGVSGPIHLIFGDREIPLSISTLEDSPGEESPQKEGRLFQIPESVKGPSTGEQVGKTATSEGNGANVREDKGIEKDVARLRRWFSAEVLLMKQGKTEPASPVVEDVQGEGVPEE